MEVVGFSIGVAGILSVFQTCVHGYRTLNTALELGEDFTSLSIRFRIEETRLLLWGRHWRLEDRVKVKTVTVTERQIDEDLQDILDIPSVREIVIQILARIRTVLKAHESVSNKYGGKSAQSSSTDISEVSISRAQQDESRKAKMIAHGNHIGRKLKWALKDKEGLTGLLQELVSLNDGLDKLLPRRERESLAKALVGEVLSVQDGSKQSKELVGVALGEGEGVAARMGRTLQQNLVGTTDNPFSNEAIIKTMELPISEFLELVEPRPHKTVEMPIPRSRALYKSTVVLIEWRDKRKENFYSDITDEQLQQRREHVSILLNRTDRSGEDYRVLHCLGWVQHKVRSTEGDLRAIVGFVFEYPSDPDLDTLSTPVTLRSLLDETSFEEKAAIPELGARIALATHLATALYQLQCVGWLHRKMSSYNFLFFPLRNGTIDYRKPYLGGWQYARPDDQQRHSEDDPAGENIETEGLSSMFVNQSSEQRSLCVSDLALYDKSFHFPTSGRAGMRLVRRFKRTDDTYSLGLILMEIVFWEPILAMASERLRREAQKEAPYSTTYMEGFGTTVRRVVEDELAGEVGLSYKNAVLECVKGFSDLPEEEKEFESALEGFTEAGLESKFYWKVVRVLESLRL